MSRPHRLLKLAAALVTILMVGWISGPVQAQPMQPPPMVTPVQPWGGQMVPEGVPYQPSSLFVQPAPPAPLLLDELPLNGPDPIRVAGLTTNTVPLTDLLAEADEPQLPPGARDGVLQKLFFTSTWIPRLESDSVGVGDFETGLVLGFPLMRRDTPLLVTPRFALHTLDGPVTPHLPPRLYDASVEFRHLRKLRGPWAMDMAVALGYYSDLERSSSDAFRVTGYGLAVYESSPRTKWVLGVAYLNRAGASVLPIGGVIYQPSPDLKWELVVPRPRIAWRVPGCNSDCGDERWLYVAGEFGGGVWAFEVPGTSTLDLLTYRDYRVALGYERKTIGGLSRRVEIGYLFGRELEFDSSTPDTTLDDSLYVRAGLTF